MPHSCEAFVIAEKIAKALLEDDCIHARDILRVRGIIQIILEEKK